MNITEKEKFSSAKKILNNNDGFTFVELMITLVITSLLIIGISQGLISGTRIIEKATMYTNSTTTFLEMDDLVREMVGRVYVPFWYSEIPVEENSDYLEIPFYEGEKDSFLTISFNNSYLHIGLKDLSGDGAGSISENENEYQSKIIRSFHAFSKITIEPAVNSEQEIFGVSLSVYPMDESNPPFTIVAPFGSNPLYSAD